MLARKINMIVVHQIFTCSKCSSKWVNAKLINGSSLHTPNLFYDFLFLLMGFDLKIKRGLEKSRRIRDFDWRKRKDN
jgi:hypothetical protein